MLTGTPGAGTRALEEAKPVHARWSEANRAYLDFIEGDPARLGRAAYASIAGEPTLQHFSIQPWPLFVDAAKLRETGEMALGMDRLVKGVVERFLGNDPKAVAHFYRSRGNMDGSPLQAIDLGEMMLALLADEPNGLAGAPSRADYIETADGLQMIEYNAGGAVGGIQMESVGLLHLAAEPTARFLRERGLRARAPEILTPFFANIVDDTARLGVWQGGELVVALVVRPNTPGRLVMHAAQPYTERLNRALEARGAEPAGRVILCAAEELAQERGFIVHEGRRVHAVVEQHAGHGDLRAAFRAFKTGRVNLFSGPVAALLNDKRNLVLLSEHAGSDDFTAAERDLIERHLPWTRAVLPGSTTFRGRSFRVPEDVVARREALVLKKASSIGGRFVEVGRYRTEEAWARAVERALWEEDWVVQEYLPTVPYAFQSGDGAVPHEMVWGLFAFGGRFGGVFLRLAAAGRTDGRINGAQGAEVGTVLEVLD